MEDTLSEFLERDPFHQAAERVVEVLQKHLAGVDPDERKRIADHAFGMFKARSEHQEWPESYAAKMRETYSKRPVMQDYREWFNAERCGIFWHCLLDGADVTVGLTLSSASGGYVERYAKEAGKYLSWHLVTNELLKAHPSWFPNEDGVGPVKERIFGKVEHLRCHEFDCFHKHQKPALPDLSGSTEYEDLEPKKKGYEFL